MTDLILQAATDSAMAALLLNHGLLAPGETGYTATNGVTYSNIGRAEVNGTSLAGVYAWIGLEESYPGLEQLVIELAPHTYTGPALRARLGGGNFSPDRAQAIKLERDRRILACGYKAGGKWFHSDLISRSQQIGLVVMGAGIPAGLKWKTMDGSFIEMTPELAQEVFIAAAASDTAYHAAAEVVIQGTGTVADVVWPAAFS